MSCRFFLDDLSFNRKGLGDIRKIRIVVECCCDPDTAGFDTAMTETGLSGIGCVAPVSKSVLQIVEQDFLIGFCREVIMGFAFFDEASGESALGE